MSRCRYDLRRDGIAQAIQLRFFQRGIHRELHRPVRAMRDTVTPADRLVVTAIIIDRGQIRRRTVHHCRAFVRTHPRRNAIGARHFRQHQRRKRPRHALRIRRVEHALQAIAQRAQPIVIEGVGAQKRLQPLVTEPIAQRGIGRCQAVGQRRHQRIAPAGFQARATLGFPARQCLARPFAGWAGRMRDAAHEGQQRHQRAYRRHMDRRSPEMAHVRLLFDGGHDGPMRHSSRIRHMHVMASTFYARPLHHRRIRPCA